MALPEYELIPHASMQYIPLSVQTVLRSPQKRPSLAYPTLTLSTEYCCRLLPCLLCWLQRQLPCACMHTSCQQRTTSVTPASW